MDDIIKLLENTTLADALAFKVEREDCPQRMVLLASKATVSAALKARSVTAFLSNIAAEYVAPCASGAVRVSLLSLFCPGWDATFAQTLAKHRILSAPLVEGEPASEDDAEIGAVDAEGKPRSYLGVVDMQDLLNSLLNEFPLSRADGFPAIHDDQAAWKEMLLSVQASFLGRPLAAAAGHGDGLPVLNSKRSSSLLELAVAGGMSGGVGPAALLMGAAAGAGGAPLAAPLAAPPPLARPPPVRRSVEFRRLRIRPCVNHRLAILDGSGAVSDVFSQSDLLHFVKAHIHALGPLADKSLRELGLGHPTDPGVTLVDEAAPAIAALQKLRTAHVTAVPLVDAEGRLTGCLSPSDLRSVAGGGLEALAEPCCEYLRRAQAQRGAGAPPAGKGAAVSSAGLRVISCGADAPLREAIDLICDHGVHRVFVVDGEGAPQGVISLTDVIRTIVKPAEE